MESVKLNETKQENANEVFYLVKYQILHIEVERRN